MSAATISASTAALISALVGAAGVTTGVVESVKSGDQNSANQANLSKQEAVLGASGQAQQQTGGSLTDPGTTALTDLLAGYPGFQAGSGTSTGTGTGANGVGTSASANPGSTGSASTPDIASILAALRGQNGGAGSPGATSSISGGNWQTQPAAPQTQLELANPLV
jgi:hypothetical protein